MSDKDYEDTTMDELMLEQIKTRRRINQRRYERMAQRSHILRKTKQENSFSKPTQKSKDKREEVLEGTLDNFMHKVEMKRRHERELEISPWYSHQRIGEFIIKNIDFFTTTFLEVNALAVTYPFQTLKTRIQSKHKKQDLCHFIKNKVDRAPMHRGVSLAFFQVVIGNAIHFNVSRIVDFTLIKDYNIESYYWRKILSYMTADIISSPFRLYFEVRKMLRQMNIDKITFSKQIRSFYLAYIPFIFRDIIFRTSMESIYHISIFASYNKIQRERSKLGFEDTNTLNAMLKYEHSKPQHERLGLFIVSVLVAAGITMPFDVVTTRLVTQQVDKYSGFVNCFKLILREEGWQKFFSGYGPRTGYFFLHGSILMALTPRLKPYFEEAYSYDYD